MLEDLKELDVTALGSLALAYIGDAVYEVYIRHHLLSIGQVKPNRLHKEATKYVSAKSQSAVVHYLLNEHLLTEEEETVIPTRLWFFSSQRYSEDFERFVTGV